MDPKLIVWFLFVWIPSWCPFIYMNFKLIQLFLLIDPRLILSFRSIQSWSFYFSSDISPSWYCHYYLSGIQVDHFIYMYPKLIILFFISKIDHVIYIIFVYVDPKLSHLLTGILSWSFYFYQKNFKLILSFLFV